MRICSCTGGLPSHQNITRRVSLSECGSIYHHLITIFSKDWLRPMPDLIWSQDWLYTGPHRTCRDIHTESDVWRFLWGKISKETKHMMSNFSLHEIIVRYIKASIKIYDFYDSDSWTLLNGFEYLNHVFSIQSFFHHHISCGPFMGRWCMMLNKNKSVSPSRQIPLPLSPRCTSAHYGTFEHSIELLI